MENFGDLSQTKQWLVLLAVGALLSFGAYFFVFKSMKAENDLARQALNSKLAENAELETYRPRLAQMDQQVENLKLQLAIQQRIVPDEKRADEFIHMMQGEAAKAGVEIRRYTANTLSPKEFYTEAPFELELDGPYYSVLNFFDRVAHLERIINVSNLAMASVKKPTDAKPKHTYDYAPHESVVVTCVATTFFSHAAQNLTSPQGPALRPVSAVAK
jgi:type IV pilus assembly protein PilO